MEDRPAPPDYSHRSFCVRPRRARNCAPWCPIPSSGFYYRPGGLRPARRHATGLALSACLSDLPALLRPGRRRPEHGRTYEDIFGAATSTELHTTGCRSKAVLLVRSPRTGHPSSTNDCHYLTRKTPGPGSPHVHSDGKTCGREPHAHEHRPALCEERRGNVPSSQLWDAIENTEKSPGAASGL